MAQAIVVFRETAGSGGANLQRFVLRLTFFGDDVSAEIASDKQLEIEVTLANNFTTADLNDAILAAVQVEADRLGLTIAFSDVRTFELIRLDYSGEAFLKSLEPIAEFRKGVGITSSGGFVSRWADQSGHGNDLIQNTATNQPALQSDGSLLFDGIDNFMTCTISQAQPVHLYFKGKQVTWTLNDGILNASAANTCSLYQAVSTPRLAITADAAHFVGGTPAVVLAVNTDGVIAWCFDGANSSLQVDNNAPLTGDAGTTALPAFNLGAGNAGTQPSNIQVDHLLIYNANHGDTPRSKLITYLLSLPS